MMKIASASDTNLQYIIDGATWSASDTREILAKQKTVTALSFKGQVNTLDELKIIHNLLLEQQVGFESYIYYGKSKVCISLELLQYNVVALSNNLKIADMDDAENFFDFSVLCSQYDMNCYRETANYHFS